MTKDQEYENYSNTGEILDEVLHHLDSTHGLYCTDLEEPVKEEMFQLNNEDLIKKVKTLEEKVDVLWANYYGKTAADDYEYEEHSNKEMSNILTETYSNKTVQKICCDEKLMVIHFADKDKLIIEVEKIDEKIVPKYDKK